MLQKRKSKKIVKKTPAVPKSAKQRAVERRITLQHIKSPIRPERIRVVFVCEMGVIRSARSAKNFEDLLFNRGPSKYFKVEFTGTESSEITRNSKIFGADFVVAMSPQIASSLIPELSRLNQKMRPPVINLRDLASSGKEAQSRLLDRIVRQKKIPEKPKSK